MNRTVVGRDAKVLWGVVVVAALSCQGVRAQNAGKVRPYRVGAGLKNDVNAASVGKILPISSSHIRVLQRNAFVASPTNAQQIFQIYEENDYKNIPSFVSTDGVLQLYHIFYDYALRQVETDKLSPALKQLTAGMLKASVTDYNALSNAQLKAAALKNVAFFGVASRLLGESAAVPDVATPLVERELARIAAHSGFAPSAIFPYQIDYSQFIARGHYTRTPALSKYFGAMMWFGNVPFALKTDGKRNDAVIQQGLLWVRELYAANQAGTWAKIYEPTAFFVGSADDQTPRDWKTISDRIFGAGAGINDFADAAKLARFVAQVEKARKPRIAPRYATQMGAPRNMPGVLHGPLASGPQLRFMGQRYIPDSEIMQRLTVPVQRVFPSGLDVMAVLGSARARTILDQSADIYNPRGWSGYRPERQKLTRQFAALPVATWNSNLYYGWLYALKALLEPAPAGYPSFMHNAAWDDKSLHSALASWGELRHDTILYGKQSSVEQGGGEDERPFVKGYVEPNVLFYDRLSRLTRRIAKARLDWRGTGRALRRIRFAAGNAQKVFTQGIE